MKLEIFIPTETTENLNRVEDLIIHLLFSDGFNNVTKRNEVVFKLNRDGVVYEEENKIYSCSCKTAPSNLINEIKRLIPQSMVNVQ